MRKYYAIMAYDKETADRILALLGLREAKWPMVFESVQGDVIIYDCAVRENVVFRLQLFLQRDIKGRYRVL